jgi:uncharacterized membrane protein
MIWLVVGVLLWSGAHLFKRLAPRARRGMGDAAKGMVAGASLLALVLMVLGYRMADVTPLWIAPAWTWHLNNLLMVIAVILFAASTSPNRLKARMRHPMLAAVVIWAAAHLLVNGDVPSLVLFGGLGLWALASIALINRAEPRWTPPKPTGAGDARWAVVAVVMFAVFAGVHILLGHSPFPSA